MSDVVLRVMDLRKTYVDGDVETPVLKGIDLEFHRGEFVALMGPSGSGKSTLLSILGTLLRPTAGEVELVGNRLSALDDAAVTTFRNQHIGFVFQFHHLLPEFNALENVLMPGLIQGRSRKDMEPRAMSLLEEVGLKDRVLHRPGELSGGEQQRVALARALVLEPKMLLADEPTGNLDSRTSEQIHQLFFSVNEARKTTIIIVTHNAALAAGMARVVTLRDGRVEHDERRKPMGYRDAENLANTSERAGTGKVDVG